QKMLNLKNAVVVGRREGKTRWSACAWHLRRSSRSIPGRSAKVLRRAQKQSAASSISRLSRRHSSREGAATKVHPRQPSWPVKNSNVGSITRCLPKNGKDESASLRRVQKSFAICEASCPNRRSEYIACMTMRWPRFFDDPTYRNP